MPSNEGRTLQQEWFTEFAWLRFNQDGTCHCSCCLWASKNNQLSAKNTKGIHKSRWAKETNGWQDYRIGKSALRSHHRSAWHQAAIDALQVCMANFIILIATLKYRCCRLSAMQLIVHQLSFY